MSNLLRLLPLLGKGSAERMTSPLVRKALFGRCHDSREHSEAPLGVRNRLGLALLLACLANLQPPPEAVSDFTFYTDINSAATTNCIPTCTPGPFPNCVPGGTLCTGQCAMPTCGTQTTPCHKIQDSLNLANCTIGSNTALEADVIV